MRWAKRTSKAHGRRRATFTVTGNAYRIAITPDGTRAYVTNTAGQNISVIDTRPTDNTVILTINAGGSAGDQPNTIAITPDGTRAYVTWGGDPQRQRRRH